MSKSSDNRNNIIISAIDMFFQKFPNNPFSWFTICMLNAYQDCAAIGLLPHLRRLTQANFYTYHLRSYHLSSSPTHTKIGANTYTESNPDNLYKLKGEVNFFILYTNIRDLHPNYPEVEAHLHEVKPDPDQYRVGKVFEGIPFYGYCCILFYFYLFFRK